LAESERRFRALTEKGADLITVVDAQGIITYETPNLLPTLGYNPGDLIGRSIFELVHPDDLARTEAVFREIVQEPGAIREVEARVRAKNDAWRWLASVGTNLLDDPAVRGVVLNSRDTTERREAEDSLAARERRFRALTEKAAGDIILLDGAGTVVYETPQEVTLLGYQPGDLAGRSGFELIHPDDLQMARQTFAEALLTPGASVKGQLRMRRKDQGWGWIRFRATNLLHEPDVGAVVLNLHNITDLREAEEALSRLNATLEQQVVERTEALRESEAIFRGYFESVAIGAAQINADGRYIRVNNRFCDITGYKREELLGGMGPIDLTYPEDRELDQQAVTRVLKGEGYEMEKRYLTKGGRLVWVHVTVSAVLDRIGRFRSSAAVIEDITERKLAEKVLKEMNETLERRVAERTAQLHDRSERLALLSDAAGALLTASDPLMFLNGIYGRLSELIGLEVCAHYQSVPGMTHLELAVCRGIPDEVAPRIQRLEMGQAFVGSVALSGQRVLIEDVQHSADDRAAFIRSLGLTAYVCYPLVAKGALLGTLALGTRKRTTFDPEELALIQTVCNEVAAAIERRGAEEALRQAHDDLERRVAERTAELASANEQLVAETTERLKLQGEIVAASERERERLGRDLHDGLCQLLTGARLKAESLAAQIESRLPECSPRAKTVAALLSQALEESRNLSRGLEPVSNDPEGLAAALHQLADSTTRLFGVACSCTIGESAMVVDHNAATELFRIAQEAASNAIKHGHATMIAFRLSCEPEGVQLQVTNDGKAFPKRARTSGMGLKTMHFRASQIGATLTVQAGTEGGTIVLCTLPRSTRAVRGGGESASPQGISHVHNNHLRSHARPDNVTSGGREKGAKP
jgi:PAS domain S-box-containing protein